MSYNFEVESGKTVKFPVGGKYCDRDIVVSATGGGGEMLDELISGTITSISSQVDTIRGYTFSSCRQLADASLPNLKIVPGYAFRSCNRLKRVFIPIATKVEQNAFSGDASLQWIDFSGCTAVANLDNVNAFASVPSTCEIRVPIALLDEWKAATNWAALDLTFVGV